MSLWHKGSVKLRYDADSHITIPSSFYGLLKKLFLHIRAEQHTVAKLTDTPKPYTEVEIIPDTVAKILCVGTLASHDKEVARLSPKHDDFL